MCKHGTKAAPVFLPADVEASWSLLSSLVSLLSGGTVQPEKDNNNLSAEMYLGPQQHLKWALCNNS